MTQSSSPNDGMPKTITAKQLFTGYDLVKIPEYQRHYTWGKENVIQFFEDIVFDIQKFHKDNTKKPRQTVYGSIIGMERNNGKVLEVIDGQQRLATLSMYILSLIHLVWKYKENSNLLYPLLGIMNNFVVKGEAGSTESRFDFNYTDKNYWDKVIYTFFNPESNSCYNLKKTLKNVDEEAQDTELQNNKLGIAINTLLTQIEIFLARRASSDEEIAKILVRLWTWVENSGAMVPSGDKGKTKKVNYGLRFTKIIEDNIHTALMRFDRENNRGIQVTVDDLAKSYLIEAVERNETLSSDKKDSNKKEILKAWKTFQSVDNAALGGDRKEKIIQWFLIMKTGHPGLSSRRDYLKVLKMNLQIETIKSTHTERYKPNPWDPVKTAKEIAVWVAKYQALVKSRQEADQTYYNLRFLEKMISPWSFITALAIATEENEPHDTEVRHNLPIRLIANLEYCLIRGLICPGDYKSNEWELQFRIWTAWIGRIHYKLSSKEVPIRAFKSRFTPSGPFWEIESTEPLNDDSGEDDDSDSEIDISKPQTIDDIDSLIDLLNSDLKNFVTKRMTNAKSNFFNANSFIEYYQNLATDDKFQSSSSMGSERRAAHYRIMSQAEYHLMGEQPSILKDHSQKGLTIEHIFPVNSSQWQKDEKYNSDLLDKLRLYPNHIGNHTLITGTWNTSLGNRTFEKKQFEPVDEDEPKCYSEAGLEITRCLANSDVVKWSPENILIRGETFLKIWIKESDVEIEGKVEEIDVHCLKPLTSDSERKLNALIMKDEGVDMEWKSGYWIDDRKGDENSEGVGRYSLRKSNYHTARLNQTINAFANTRGGDIIIGKSDDSTNIDDIKGAEDLIQYYENEYSRIKKITESQARSTLKKQITQHIQKYYPNELYTDMFYTVDIKALRTGKRIIHIQVDRYENKGGGQDGPLPYVGPTRKNSEKSSKIYYWRSGEENRLCPINDKRFHAGESEDLYEFVGRKPQVLDETKNTSNYKMAVIGPFTSSNTANSWILNSQHEGLIEQTNFMIRRGNETEKNIEFVSFNDKIIEFDGDREPMTIIGKAEYQVTAESMQKNGVWECKHNGDNGCWVVNLTNLSHDWDLPGEEIEIPEIIENVPSRGQKAKVWTLILKLTAEKGDLKFTRKEFLNKYEEQLKSEWNAKNVGQNISRLFQELRDDGKLKFLDEKGTYQIA